MNHRESPLEVGNKLQYFGDYELLEEIARGGMGVVYRARQINLNRVVALKMILSGEFACGEEIQRFKCEAEAAAQLDHPGIVPIHEIGEHGGRHYYSMGFVEGHSLADQLHDGPMPPRKAAELVLKAAEAVDFANRQGVIHRDLKPANILIDTGGNPRVTDFGIAKRLGSSSDLTRSGQILGTPAYMPPEQAACKFSEIGPTTDVYSLGAILYALLTGRAPFEADNPLDTLMQVLESEAILPSKSKPGIPVSLESICMKCLEKKPTARYATAKELAHDLECFLHDEPVAARPPNSVQNFRRWCRQKPALVVHAVAILAMLLIVQITYLAIGTDLAYHLRHTGVLVLWLATATGLQQLASRPRWNELAVTVWCIADVLFLTMILCLAEPPIGPLLSGFALLIVASGFLFRAYLVVVTTATVLCCFCILIPRFDELTLRLHYSVMYALIILVLGGAVTTQVRRISRLSRHFESQAEG